MSKYNALSKWKFSLTLASFSLLADYLSVKLTSKEAVKAVKGCNYLTYIKTLPKASFNLFHATQTAKLLLDNDTISYVICLTNTTNKANIDSFSMKYKQVTCNIVATKVYAIAYKFDIKK